MQYNKKTKNEVLMGHQRKIKDHALEMDHLSVIGSASSQPARPIQSTLSPPNQWQSTQLNVHHVAHMDRVEVSTPHPAD